MHILCLLTEREGRIVKNWPEVVAVKTESNDVCTNASQISQAWLEQARIESSLLYGTPAVQVEITSFRDNTIHGLCPFLKEQSVWQNPDQERTNQTVRIYRKTGPSPYNNEPTIIVLSSVVLKK